MAMGSQQLADDYGQLKDLLELYPNISIIKVEGQPPDNYEIEYKLRGYCKDANNEISIGTIHRVRVSLPFGYPHFAPIAKPLTPIFHPDIDPAAIRIADRWQQNPSLPDLSPLYRRDDLRQVLQPGRPLQPGGSRLVQSAPGQLPLDSLSLADIEEPDDGFDSLVDDTFASLGLESDDFLEPVKAVSQADIDHIRELVNSNNVFTANKLLVELPDDADVPDREELQQNIGKALRKTDQLFKLAEQLEDVGKLDEAIEVMDNLHAIAADAPGAEALRSRIQQSYLLAQSVGGNKRKEEHAAVGQGSAGEKKPSSAREQSQTATNPAATVHSLQAYFICHLAAGFMPGSHLVLL